MEYAAVIGAVVGLFTQLLAMGQEGEALALRKQLAAQYGDDILPHLDKAVAQVAPDSAFGQLAGTSNRPQMEVDAELANIYDTAGQTTADQAAYDVARRGVSQAAGQQAGDIASMAARRGGVTGGLQAALISQTGQDELNALGGLNASIAADSRGRALQALMGRASNASAMRGQDWREASDRAAALDLTNRFNATQQQQAELTNQQLPQQAFNNRLALLAGRQGATEGAAGNLERAAAGTRQQGAQLGQSAISFGQAWDDDEKEKK